MLKRRQQDPQAVFFVCSVANPRPVSGTKWTIQGIQQVRYQYLINIYHLFTVFRIHSH